MAEHDGRQLVEIVEHTQQQVKRVGRGDLTFRCRYLADTGYKFLKPSLQLGRWLSVGFANICLYASATLRMSFPVFSPLKSFSNVSGNVSSPSTMSSRDLSLPAAIHPAISRAASG